MRRPSHTANNSKIENSRFYFDASEASFVYKSPLKEMELISMPEDPEDNMEWLNCKIGKVDYVAKQNLKLASLAFLRWKKMIYSVMNLGQGQRYYDRALASEDGVHKAELWLMSLTLARRRDDGVC